MKNSCLGEVAQVREEQTENSCLGEVAQVREEQRKNSCLGEVAQVGLGADGEQLCG